jgi:hypothetical protein
MTNENNNNDNESHAANIEKYNGLYNTYSRMFNNDICVLYYCNGIYYNFVNANKIYKILHTDLNLIYVNDIKQSIYKTTFKNKYLAKNIHALLDNDFSVILTNTQYNVVAIHHPANKYNTYFIPF